MMKSNCFVLAIFIFLAVSRTFAFTGIFDCSDGAWIGNPRWGNDSTNALVLTIDLKGPSPIQAVGNYKIYFYSTGKEANTTESYYVFMHTDDWVNGYSNNMFTANGDSTWVGANPYSLALTYSPIKFPPSGTMVTIQANIHYGCTLASDLSNCFVLAIFIFLAVSRTFAFTGIFDCSDGAWIGNPRWGNDSTNALVLTIDLKGPSPIQAVGNYKIYFYSTGKEANTTESYYVFMHTDDWVNGYSNNMFTANGDSTWVGANPYSLALTYSPIKFPPSGTMVTIQANIHYGCTLASDLVCHYCPIRIYTRCP
ncbi:hypothetical protein Glove_54g155 [Diversispora epigaea]|uniref:Uncharacterized protein n=1 Tax=Diversispora epigaea TaxID=1348612 RepID=A0A397JJA9_9GLOM|nr:hypothetical protein Glove_54g157 [Diversispora epigaea]RHZ86086.1 hypothetical protein Glove_54g155 [Diversispora epigaea]